MIHGGDAQTEVGGHLLAGLVLDGQPPKRLPGGVGDVAADLRARPGEHLLFPLRLPLYVLALGGGPLLQDLPCLAFAVALVPLGAPPFRLSHFYLYRVAELKKGPRRKQTSAVEEKRHLKGMVAIRLIIMGG